MAAETVENNQSSALNTPETDFPATDSASMPEHNYPRQWQYTGYSES